MDCTAEIEDTCTGTSREFIFEVTDTDTDPNTDTNADTNTDINTDTNINTNTGTDTNGKLTYMNNIKFRSVINLTICTIYLKNLFFIKTYHKT